MTPARWLIVALLAGFTFLAHFNRISISVAANRHFIGPDKLSEEQVGLVYFAFLLVYTLLMLPGGAVIDHVGPRRAMTWMGLGLGLWAAVTGSLGWSGLAVSALLLPLLLIRALAGATSVPLHPGAARAVSLWVPLPDRSSANGLVTAGALLGIAFTYPVFGWLMDRAGWPTAFVVCGVTLMGFALVWWVTSRPLEQQLAVEIPPRPTSITVRDVVSVFRSRDLVLLTLSYGAVGYVQYMFFYWVEYYFGKELQLPPTESREAAFTITLAMAAGMACGGWVSDRMCRWLGLQAGCRAMALGGMGLGALFSVLGVSTRDPELVVIYFSFALGALGLCEGIFWTTAPMLAGRHGGLACALMNTGGNGVGMLAPIVTPVLGQAFGWTTAVIVACVVCGVGGVMWLGIRPRHETEQ